MALTLPLASIIIILLYGYWKLGGKRNSNTLPLPPGPPGDPIIGHVRIIPALRPEVTYMEWAKKYNTDIIYLSFLGQPIIILNKSQDAITLLEKRGVKYSDRLKAHFFEEQGWTDTLTLFSQGPRFRKHRRIFQNHFTVSNCVKYQPAQQQEAYRLVARLIENPKEWQKHLVAFSTTVILRISHGIEVKGVDDPYVEIADDVSSSISYSGSTGSTIVDFFPLIRLLPNWFSFIPSLKYARSRIPSTAKLHDLPFEDVKQQIVNGGKNRSFTRSQLEERTARLERGEKLSDEITDEDIKGVGGTMYTAGQETSWSTLMVFILSMVLNPEVQRKGLAEIEAVIGKDRLPNFSDRPNLPYVENIVNETFRWNPVVPLGIPHKSSEEDTYQGYYIPKGTIVMANCYAMNRDPSIYKNPEAFNPDRYFPISQGGAGEPLPTGHFGFGRRICPGLHLGSSGVWIGIATLLATLQISKAKDEKGEEITPPPESMTTGITSHPHPFLCKMEPRSGEVVGLVAAAV